MMMEVARRERPKQSHGDIAQSWPGLTFPGSVALKCSRWRLAGCGVRWCQVNHGKFHLEIRIMSQSE